MWTLAIRVLTVLHFPSPSVDHQRREIGKLKFHKSSVTIRASKFINDFTIIQTLEQCFFNVFIHCMISGVKPIKIIFFLNFLILSNIS